MTDREAFDAFIKDSECIHVPSALAAWQAALESALGKIRADVQAAGLANGGIESAADVVPEILSQTSEKIEAATAAERERCAKVCEAYAIDQHALYKGKPPYTGKEPGRYSPYIEGMSDGADVCADKIRSGE
jgi:hypothetical protein